MNIVGSIPKIKKGAVRYMEMTSFEILLPDFFGTDDVRKVDVMIYADSWETSRAWGHEVSVMMGGRGAKHRTTYYNRTWERWAYESCLYSALEDIMQNEIDRAVVFERDYHFNGKFPKGKKQEVIDKAKKENYKVFVCRVLDEVLIPMCNYGLTYLKKHAEEINAQIALYQCSGVCGIKALQELLDSYGR